MRRPLVIVVILLVAVLAVLFLLARVGIVPIPGISPETAPVTNPNETPTAVGPTNTPLTLTTVVIALQPLPRGTKIPAEGALAEVQWPISLAPQNAITSAKQAVGKIARTDIAVEQPIISTILVNDLSQIAASGSDAAAVLPRNYAAISIPVDRLADVAYAPQDGDCVDIVASFLFVDVDEEFQTLKPNKITLINISQGGLQFLSGLDGRIEATSLGIPAVISPREVQRPRLVTRDVISGALVIHRGTFPVNGQYLGILPTPTPIPQENTASSGNPTQGPPPPTPIPPYPDVMTLGVPVQDSVALAWFVQARIPMTLVLRSVQDKCSQQQTQGVTFRYLLDNYGLVNPAKLPFSLEPALRSIRQVAAGSDVSLSGPASGQ
ncbi:MAG TPA: SAF domain-containing protein [Aggregatilineales bacterium]|nr:SAF domain-containing protein [Aggregatilineales bacterium]